MKPLACLVGLLCLTGIAFGQEYQSRQPYPDESRRVAGLKNYAQDEFTRANTPVWVVNSLLYLSTNSTDGVIFVKTNATVLVHIGLPNPTNNLGRKYSVTTMGASTAVLTNHYVTGTFTEINTMAVANSLTIASNKTAIAYSTGTNYVVRTY
jgi:hypothetical protein